MNGKLSYRDGARQDLISTYRRFTREAGVGVADRFLRSAESRFRRLADMPGIGTRYDLDNPLVGELRFLPLTARFRQYIVLYRPVAAGIEIVRVLHGARDIQTILAGEFAPDNDEEDTETT